MVLAAPVFKSWEELSCEEHSSQDSNTPDFFFFPHC